MTEPDDGDPFLRCFHRSESLPNPAAYRLLLAQRYSYVLAERLLLEAVRRYSPLVEIGAGTGYWAYRLRLIGADIVAYDQAPAGGSRENRYHPDIRAWTEVKEADAAVLARHRDRALFICWPPAYSALWESLRFYRGEVVVYLGDWGGRTARLAGLDRWFEQVEAHPATALDPAPDRPAMLTVWRRSRTLPRGNGHRLLSHVPGSPSSSR